VVFCLCFIAILLVCANVARAEYIDLKGEEVVAQVPCVMYNKKFLCVVVKKGEDTYLVLVDQKGEHSIYKSIKDEAVLIWSRDSV
jgi:hypothetical protein